MEFRIAPIVILVLSISACGSDETQLPDQKLLGTIDGDEWEIKFSNAYRFSSDNKYRIRLLSTLEPGNDPCVFPVTGNAHVSMIIKPIRGSFSVPFPIIDESPRFNWSDGSSAIATSGFLEVFEVNNARIFGFLQAQLDDNNTVEGSFEVIFCN